MWWFQSNGYACSAHMSRELEYRMCGFCEINSSYFVIIKPTMCIKGLNIHQTITFSPFCAAFFVSDEKLDFASMRLCYAQTHNRSDIVNSIHCSVYVCVCANWLRSVKFEFVSNHPINWWIGKNWETGSFHWNRIHVSEFTFRNEFRGIQRYVDRPIQLRI